MSITSTIGHIIFGHDNYRDPTEGEYDREEELPSYEVPGLLDKITRLDNGYKCQRGDCEHIEYDVVEYKGFCKCGEIVRGDSLLEMRHNLDEHLGEVNHRKCETCGKVFTGENAGQKVGGHKRTHDESSA